ncbi:MAG: FKBP-type peptidyl-prolyl cis-trans isomerase [Clostridium sp.]|nr:FKBP-type peptidyl-prolyl cis-trans isomerase [Clostridium sp.]
MKKYKLTLPITAALTAASIFAGCGSESTWEKYEKWRDTNNEFYNTMVARQNPDGTPYYTELKPSWYPSSGVLIHYFNDRSLTDGNLSPLQTSYVTTKYRLSLYNGTAVDSSYAATDSLFTAQLSTMIAGWQVALSDMRVGDSVQVVIPSQAGYGTAGSGSVLPYSVLLFDIKLVDIPYYEVPEP